MALTLSRKDLTHFEALQATLLSPLDYQNVDDWGLDVCRRAEAFLGGNRSALLLPLPDRLHYVSDSIAPAFMKGFEDAIEATEPGVLRFSESIVDEAYRTRRTRQISVWTVPMLARLVGIQLEDSAMYNEVVRPAGLASSAVVSMQVPEGEAFVGISNAELAASDYDEEEWIAKGRMLVAPFRAGVSAIVQLHRKRAEMSRMLDQLGQAILVTHSDGRELHRTSALAALLAEDACTDRILGELRRVASSVARALSGRHCPPAGMHRLQTATAAYRIHGTSLAAGLLSRQPAILVSIERATPELPDIPSLVERHGLTTREAEVALLLARGLSNRQIAKRLRISAHTVRHHAEWVFSKLDIHTRKALALRLLDQAVS